ncbi:isochorismatase family cysteine hydrolase [Marinobacter sp. ANT_B65]|uniref:cysteine hydrolase family protein n=1 Tax=Marinobacter sp. ANT_B65 TaxID=2039467 RepID=UPI001931110C
MSEAATFTVADARPYAWPCIAPVEPRKLALIVIDMQKDFCAPGGYIDSQGVDLTPARATIDPIQRVLAAFRKLPEALVIHTREGHRPELVDLPANKQWRSEQVCPGIGNAGPLGRILVRGEPGWEIIPELAPAPGEIVIDKPGKGAFYATDLDHILRLRGITHLIVVGLTTDVCVHTTIRDANDRGLETLILRDCTAATETRHRDAIFTMTEMQGGLFGATATSGQLLEALSTV